MRQTDFEEFDLLLAMDRGHLDILVRLSPPQHRGKLKLFLEFSDLKKREVPEPYGGGAADFEWVLDLVEKASWSLLDHVRTHLLRVST